MRFFRIAWFANTGAAVAGNRISKRRPSFCADFESLEDRELLTSSPIHVDENVIAIDNAASPATVSNSTVVSRQLFYHNSPRYNATGNPQTPLPFSDDNAIAVDKVAYRPGVVATITRLTNNTIVDQNPQVWGPNVVWQGRVAGNDQIFLYNGTSTVQLTNDVQPDSFPKISSGGAVWENGIGNSQEIEYYNGSSTMQLTNNAVSDNSATISGNHVVWAQGSVTGSQIMSYNGVTTTNLSQNSVVNYAPQVDGNNVVWISGSTPNQILFNDGTSTTLIASSLLALNTPAVSGHNVTWQGYAGTTSNDSEIYMSDGVTTTRITNNSFPDFAPEISGNRVVWWGGTFNNYQVYLYDGTVHQLSTGTINQFPQIDGQNVVWQGFDGQHYQIFLWDGQEVTQLTNTNYDNMNPQISGNHIVWQGQLGSDGTSLEIFSATFGTGAATLANVSSYSLGVNGIMVDLSSGGSHNSITLGNILDDFTFQVGNNNSPSTWAAAPLPTAVMVRPGAGVSGSDRVELIWADGAITQKWLEVTVLATADTGLTANDVFFFGSEIGDTGASNTSTIFKVGALDTTGTQTHLATVGTNQPITNIYDFNRDGSVGAFDITVDQTHPTTNATGLQAINIPTGGPFAPLPAPATSAAAATASGNASVASALAGTPSNASKTSAVPAWIANRVALVDLNHGPVAKYFELLADDNSAKSRAVLVKAERVADALTRIDVENVGDFSEW